MRETIFDAQRPNTEAEEAPMRRQRNACDAGGQTGTARCGAGVLLRALAATLALAVAACSDDTASGTRTAVRTGDGVAHKVRWLEVGSQIKPAQWLVSRSEEKLRPPSDPDVKAATSELEAAHAVYRESERMIANRAAQVSDMLADIGIVEPATTVLKDLTHVAGEVGQTEGFGGIAQHYFNLRAANVARSEALATLKARYGPRSKT